MAIHQYFFMHFGYCFGILIFLLPESASGEHRIGSLGNYCGRKWSFQPLVTGGYGCVRTTTGVFSARKCLLRGHHLALISARDRKTELVCIKDEIFITSSPTILKTEATFMITSTNNSADLKENYQISTINADHTENSFESMQSFTHSTMETFTLNDLSYSTVGVQGIFTTPETQTIERSILSTTDFPKRETELKVNLTDTKIHPNLIIGDNEKEKLTKSLVCCNSALGTG